MDHERAGQLIAAAKNACASAYAPYSGFRVGAAAVWSSGAIYTGCNVENASYGISLCAERTAIVKAVSEGERVLIAIAVVSSSREIVRPCGACLQVISEFAESPGAVEVIAGCSGIEYDIWLLSDYLPLAFVFANGKDSGRNAE